MIKRGNKKGFGFLLIIIIGFVAFLAGSFMIYELEKKGMINIVSNNHSSQSYEEQRGITKNLNAESSFTFNKSGNCGNGICEPELEEAGGPKGSCQIDCICGNEKCEPGENPENCKEDCCGYCGDGKCIGYACQEDNMSSKYYCPKQNGGDCGNVCGNGVCDKGESTCNCALDCKWQKCGDGICTPDDGGPLSCPSDCASKCGDCICASGEDYISCPNDCGYCGDLVCSNCTQLKEDSRLCSADCN